jgi:hypothetical protein
LTGADCSPKEPTTAHSSPLPTTSCQHCKPYQITVNLSIKKSPKTDSQTEQIAPEEITNEDFFVERGRLAHSNVPKQSQLQKLLGA